MRFQTILIFGLALHLYADPAVRYDLSFPHAVHHEAEVRVTFHDVGPEPLQVFMSRSSPGRYALHEFAKNIYNVKATDAAGNSLRIEHDSPDGWLITPRQHEVICSYTLFGDRVDGTYTAIDATHAHLNLPATLLWAKGLENAPAKVHFEIPPGSGWKVATQLIPNADGTFTVPDVPGMSKLEWLMDSPVELSAHTVREWHMDGITFRLAIHHEGTEAEADAFAEMCKKVVAEEKKVFGQFPKYDGGTYTFIVDYLPWANSDGMEHRNSAVISGPLSLRDSAQRAMGVVSHEFFHSWNVKRIRPRSLEPFDFERADMSGELWFAEGFTSYYGELLLCRANLISFDNFADSLSRAVNAVLNEPGAKVRSVVGMSQQAPFVDAARFIDPTDDANTFISYYTYGEALAFGIDMAIRSKFSGKSLDSWMQTMWRQHPDVNVPYTLADLQEALSTTTGDAEFARQIFEDNIQGEQPLDYARLASAAGLTLSLAYPGRVWLGAGALESAADGLELTGPTLDGSPLFRADVDRGDKIVACDGVPVRDTSKLEMCMSSHKPGGTLTLRIDGRTGTRDIPVTLAQDPTLSLIPMERLGKRMDTSILQFRERWISASLQGPN